MVGKKNIGQGKSFGSVSKSITDRKRAEKLLHLKNRMLTSITDYTQALAFAPPDQLFHTIVTKLKEITGAAEVLINDYDEETSELVLSQTTLSDDGNTKVRKILGRRLNGFKSPVSEDMHREITASTIGRVKSLHDASFGAIPKPVGKAIEKMLGFGWFAGLSLTHEQKLVGTILIAGKKGTPELGDEELLAYASATANVLARRKAEIDLAQSEERFRSLIEKSSDVIIVISQDLKISYLSSSYLSIYRKAPSSLIGKNIVDFATESVHEDDIASLLELFEACLETPESEKRAEFRFKSLDGTWHHLVAIGKNHFQTPSINGLVVNIRDITVQKKAREALQDSERKFRQLAENINLVFWLTDWTEKKLLYVNPAYEKIFGMTVESAYADRIGWKKAIHPDDLDRAEAKFKSHAAKGEYLELDYRIFCDSKIKWIHEKALPLKDEKGQVVRYINVAEDITERKIAENALAQSQELLRESQCMAKLGGWEFFTDTMAQVWTEETFNILEVDYDKGAPKVPEGVSFIAPEYRPMADKAIQRAMEFGEPYDQEWEVITAKGNRKWVHAVAKVNRTNGKITSVSGSFQDITERKMAEAELKHANERFFQAFHSSPILMSISDIESGRFIDVNEAMARTYGLPMEKIIGKISTEIGVWTDPETRKNTVEKIKKIGSVKNIDFILKTRAGDIRNLLWSGEFVMISGKQCLLASALDITERKNAEEQLEKTHSLLVLAQQSAGAAVWSWDIKTETLEWSPKMFEIFGLDPSKDDASFDSWRKAMHPDDRKLAEDLTNAAVRDRTRLNNVYRVILPSGEIRWINALGNTTYDGDKPIWMSGICIDITERKQLEDELEIYSEGLQILVNEKTRELEKTHDLLMKQERLAVLGQMAASVSHELRNPLSVINNVAYYLKMKFPDMDEKSVQMLDLLEKEVDRSDRIIGNMLSFSKHQSNKTEDVDLNGLVASFFSASDATPGNVYVELELSEDLPAIRADSEKLRQVLDNLVSNACQAMQDGGILTVSTKVNKSNMLELSVKDTGCGMSEETQSRIYEPLFSTKTTGFGLGLVIVKSLVDDHGGKIKVKSKVGEGSEFTVILPIEGRKP